MSESDKLFKELGYKKIEEWQKAYQEEKDRQFDILRNSISKQKVKDKIKEIEKEYDEIISDYGNIDTDVIINIPDKNVRKYLDKLVDKILILQELLEEKQ